MKKVFLFLLLIFTTITFTAAQEIDGKLRDAVNNLAARLNVPLDVNIGPVTLAGTDTPSGFSRYLHEKITNNAVNVNNGLFNVVPASRGMPRPGAAPKGIISGTFSVAGDRVEVFLQLISDSNGAIIGSQSFTVSAAELRQMGIALEPENLQSVREREQIFTELNIPPAPPPVEANVPVTADFNIFAWTNSETNTFVHGDKLTITVMADRDCYIKVYYIDVDNNPPAMIFPFRGGPDNRLRANVPIQVPGLPAPNDGYPLHDPYGTETIWIVASTVQFENIEAEYIPPGRVSTRDGIRGVITRGLSQVSVPGVTVYQAQTRFNYTILPAASY